jgi:hypothetical protein
MVAHATLRHPERQRRTAKTEQPSGLDKDANGIEGNDVFGRPAISFTHHKNQYNSWTFQADRQLSRSWYLHDLCNPFQQAPDMSYEIFSCSGGSVVRPKKVLPNRQDGGHLIVNPPRPVRERSHLMPHEPTRCSLPVAATGKAMLEIFFHFPEMREERP